MLSQPITISGPVVPGNRLGRVLGYPTANIEVGDSVDIPNGVYAARVIIGERCYEALANIGTKPTVTDSDRRYLEVHILEYSGDLYGQILTVELKEFIRPEKRFESVDLLKRQIELDKQKIKKILQQCS